MKESLKKYQNNELNAADTDGTSRYSREGVEKRLIEQAVEREMRQKWGKILTDNGIDRSTIPVFEEQDPAKDPVFLSIKRTAQRRFIMGIAASLLLVACFWWWDVSSTSALDLANSALFNERFAAPSVRMGQNDDLKNWSDAKNAYRDGHFDAAIPLIETIATPSVEQEFYLALSHIYAQKPDFEKAASGFKHILENKDDNFKDEARWYYALTAIKLGKNGEAKQNLEIIATQKGWKSKEATDLLGKLK